MPSCKRADSISATPLDPLIAQTPCPIDTACANVDDHERNASRDIKGGAACGQYPPKMETTSNDILKALSNQQAPEGMILLRAFRKSDKERREKDRLISQKEDEATARTVARKKRLPQFASEKPVPKEKKKLAFYTRLRRVGLRSPRKTKDCLFGCNKDGDYSVSDSHQEHPGNVQYSASVEERVYAYATSTSGRQKNDIASGIVQEWRRGDTRINHRGFLCWNAKTERWCDVGYRVALRVTMAALTRRTEATREVKQSWKDFGQKQRHLEQRLSKLKSHLDDPGSDVDGNGDANVPREGEGQQRQEERRITAGILTPAPCDTAHLYPAFPPMKIPMYPSPQYALDNSPQPPPLQLPPLVDVNVNVNVNDGHNTSDILKPIRTAGGEEFPPFSSDAAEEKKPALRLGGRSESAAVGADPTHLNFGDDDDDGDEEEEGANDAGVVFPSKYRTAWDIKWDARYEELVAYRKQNGHALVPNSYEPNLALGNWVYLQRLKKNDLSEDQFDRLREIGFRFESMSSIMELTAWDAKFAELATYARENVGTGVPPGGYQKRDPDLGLWVEIMKAKFQQNMLSEDRIGRLQEIGFDFYSKQQASWDERYQELIAYKKRNGSTNVPPQFLLNPALGEWVAKQKFLYSFQLTKLRSVDRTDLLRAINFDFSCGQEKYSWMTMFQELVAYAKKNGHANVPVASESDSALGHWVSIQRANFRQHKLTEEQANLLSDIRFEFKPRHKRKNDLPAERSPRQKIKRPRQLTDSSIAVVGCSSPDTRLRGEKEKETPKLTENSTAVVGSSSLEEIWKARYDDLVVYAKENGNANVPSWFEPNLNLGFWVSVQKSRFRQKKLSREQVSFLENVGFDFSIKGIS